ncbi:co-chaperone GroES [Actinotalea sp. M2MS4P-6]|uniref:co-chaperone GroES n=1 Tax=Actinotalea sp. M2MS4P-6 TaxID=2983762 RepID=UPI0021E44481|nr:co-chaperone GroES [Actinotalea sp. M2MS4P-6]MCV2395366.1 co-chaperone GroES [Actinotalea sp. M2MS4P-6]
MSESVTPLGSRVLVEILTEDSMTASGLVIPDTAKEKQQKGVIVAIGDDEETITVKVGERVLFPKYSGTELSMDGADYLVIDANDLLAVLGR